MSTETELAVRKAIYKAALNLDDQDWSAWLDLCDDDFEYAIKAYSPEIRKDMCYLNGNRKDMVTITEMLPKHNTDHSPLSRHTVVYDVQIDEATQSAQAVSSFTVHQTQLDGTNSHVTAGSSHLFLVGKYYDTFRITGDKVKFTERTVRLNTRRLDKGSHWPI